MDARQQRGMELGNNPKIRQKGNLWLVPSQSGKGDYTVNLEAETPHCTCRDHEFRRTRCKHICAVEFVIERTKTVVVTTKIKKGKAVTKTVETETVKVEKRVTYKQEWTAYNSAQTSEKARFQTMLYELCKGIEEPEQHFGRPPLSLADMIFSTVFKVYSTVSSRRFASDLSEAHQRGYISSLPHYNSVSRYLESPTLTAYLHQLITISSLPLKSVESDFAIDSSGFSTGQFERWMDVKYGQIESRRDWLKLHLMCGVRTHIVTSVEVSEAYSGDSLYFKSLVEQTAKSGFKMAEISADKAYLGASNIHTALKHGAMPYIPFKTNSRGDRNGSVWARLFHFYNFKREEFLEHYHKRSNVETVFSMIKGKFGQRLRSKSTVGQINEALCKVLAHNLCVLIQSMMELNIEPTFEAETALAS